MTSRKPLVKLSIRLHQTPLPPNSYILTSPPVPLLEQSLSYHRLLSPKLQSSFHPQQNPTHSSHVRILLVDKPNKFKYRLYTVNAERNFNLKLSSFKIYNYVKVYNFDGSSPSFYLSCLLQISIENTLHIATSG